MFAQPDQHFYALALLNALLVEEPPQLKIDQSKRAPQLRSSTGDSGGFSEGVVCTETLIDGNSFFTPPELSILHSPQSGGASALSTSEMSRIEEARPQDGSKGDELLKRPPQMRSSTGCREAVPESRSLITYYPLNLRSPERLYIYTVFTCHVRTTRVLRLLN